MKRSISANQYKKALALFLLLSLLISGLLPDAQVAATDAFGEMTAADEMTVEDELTDTDQSEDVVSPEDYARYEEEDRKDYLAVKKIRAARAKANKTGNTAASSLQSVEWADKKLVNSIDGKGLTHESQHSASAKIFGIDVSKWNGDIDWKKVKNAGVSFVIIRVGNRFSASGKLAVDPYFESYIKGAHSVGLPVGIYYFSQDISTAEAKASAQFVLKQIKKYASYISYPIFYDMEMIDGGRLDKANLSKKKRTDIWCTFCDAVKAAGYIPGVYASYYSYYDYNDNAVDSAHVSTSLFEKKGYYIWLARYNTRTYSSRPYSMWQYSSTGKVDGINSYVDLNVAYVRAEQTQATASSFSVKWDKLDKAKGYYYAVFDKKGNKLYGAHTTGRTATVTKFSDKSVPKTGQQYIFKVKKYTLDASGKKVYGKYVISAPVYTTPCDIKTIACKANSETGNGATITWSAAKGATGYEIYCKEEGRAAYKKLAMTDSTSYVIHELSPQKKYTVKVIPFVNVTGNDFYGNESGTVTFCTSVATVTPLKQMSTSKNRICIGWTWPKNVLGLQVFLYNADGKQVTEPVTIEDQTIQSYAYSGLTPGAKYICKVRAYGMNAEGTLVYGRPGRIEVKTRPEQTTGLKRKASTANSTTIVWKPVAGADGYRVYQWNASKKSWKYVKTTTQPSYSAKKLKIATKYKYRVRAFVKSNGIYGFGTYSDAYETATKAPKPKSLKIKFKSATSATLKWSKVTGATGYRILIYDRAGKLVDTRLTKKTSCKVTGLKRGKTYRFRVQAYITTGSTTVFGSSLWGRGTIPLGTPDYPLTPVPKGEKNL